MSAPDIDKYYFRKNCKGCNGSGWQTPDEYDLLQGLNNNDKKYPCYCGKILTPEKEEKE